MTTALRARTLAAWSSIRRQWRRLTPRRRVPIVSQLTETECGAACLAMAMAYHGRVVELAELRTVLGGRDGVSARAILDAAAHYGMQGKGFSVQVEHLRHFDASTILHWDFNHFVVLERVGTSSIDIVDPSRGRCRVPMERVRQSFTGVVVVLTPGTGFERSPRQRASAWPGWWSTVRQSGGLLRILVTSMLLQLFALAAPVLTGVIVDVVAPSRDHQLLNLLAIAVGGIALLQGLGAFVRAHLLVRLRTTVDVHLSTRFMEHLINLPYQFFQERSAGDLLMRLNGNAVIRETITTAALSACLDGLLVGGYLIVLVLMNLQIAMVAIALALLHVAVLALSQRRRRELMAETLQVQARARSYELDLVTGMETLKAIGAEERALQHWSSLFAVIQRVSIARGGLDALADSAIGVLRLISPLVILMLAVEQTVNGGASLGTSLALSSLAAGFLGPVASLVSSTAQFQLAGSYAERVNDVLTAPAEQERGTVRPAPVLSGQIKLEHVSFRYGPTAPFALRDICVSVSAGQTVAIVGRSGAGKSTLASLLVGLFTPMSGRILYDGIDITALDLRSVRQQLGFVPQRPHLFGSSIRSNISLDDPRIAIEAVTEAAQLAMIHDDVSQMPMRYDTLLLDGGTSLSGGQRQRIALARALAGKPAILVVDEGTNALDLETEARLEAGLAGLGMTRIFVAHRTSTIMRADVILFMENGRIVERGTHAELLRSNGAYAALFAGDLATRVAESRSTTRPMMLPGGAAE